MSRRIWSPVVLAVALAACSRGPVSASANSCTAARPFGCDSPSRFLTEPLKAAEYALKARNFELAIQKLQAAQATRGQKTTYDEFVINEMFGMAYYQQHDPKAARYLQAAAQSKYADPEQAEEWMQAAEAMRRGTNGARR